jgi:hypothetical protein
MEYILEWREYKKTKSNYTKRISISKIQLEDICDKLSLSSNIKFLSSGMYGNAYKIDDNRVLKITTDKTEANSVSDLVENDSIVKYYSINQYKLNNEFVYIIVMDYVLPILDHTGAGYYEFITLLCDTIYFHWGNLTRLSFDELVEEVYHLDKLSKLGKELIDKFWILYNNLQYLDKCPDLHYGNLGIDESGNIKLFDFNDLKRVNKFNKPNII